MDAESVSIRFDIYRFDMWAYSGANQDEVKAEIDGTSIVNLGRFNETDYGTTTDNIVWWRSPIGSALTNLNGIGGADQVHHASMMLPKYVFSDGSIKVKFYGGELNSNDVIFGIDNVEVVAHYHCSCAPSRMVAEEDFEGYPVDANGTQVRESGWMHGKIDSDPMFTKFLGRYASEVEDQELFPVNIFDVPPHADGIVVSFDFYEIDEWAIGDYVVMYVNGDAMDLYRFNNVAVELTRNGTSARGIEWVKTASPRVQMGFLAAKTDQVHHVTLRIPHAVFATGQVSLEFEALVHANNEIGSAGFDNIVITAEENCEASTAPISGSVFARSANVQTTSGCNAIEEKFVSKPHQCSMGYFGAEHIQIVESNDSTVKFKLSDHSFPDVTLNEVKVWFLDPTRSYNDDFYDKCWSGVADSNQNGLFAQEFVAKCEDGWSTVNLSGGGDNFHHDVDVTEPLCSDRVVTAEFNPMKRCFWQFKIPCTCNNRRELGPEVSSDDNKDDCNRKSLVEDAHPVQVD